MAQRGLRAVVSLLLIASGATAVPAAAWEERAKAGVVMLRATVNGASVFGAGLIVARKGRTLYVATANHLLAAPEGNATDVELQVYWNQGKWLDASLLASDTSLDLRLVSAESPSGDLPPFPHPAASSETLSRGAKVHAIGYPGGRSWKLSAVPDVIEDLEGTRIVFQSSSVQPGNSGGGLFDACGRLVGMVTDIDASEVRAAPVELVLRSVRRALPGVEILKASTGGCADESSTTLQTTTSTTRQTTSTTRPREPDTCNVTIRSTPSGATVVVDGTTVGRTPLTTSFEEDRSYKLRLRKTGYVDYEREADCTDRTIRAELERDEPDEESAVDIQLAYTGDLFACRLVLQVRIGDSTATPTSNPFTMKRVPPGNQPYNISGQVFCPNVGMCAANGSGSVNVEAGKTYQLAWQNTAYGSCQVQLLGPFP